MSRYFFHIRDGLIFVPEEEGMACRDLLAAWEEALAGATDIALADLGCRSVRARPIIEVEDEDGAAMTASRILN